MQTTYTTSSCPSSPGKSQIFEILAVFEFDHLWDHEAIAQTSRIEEVFFSDNDMTTICRDNVMIDHDTMSHHVTMVKKVGLIIVLS